MVTVFLSSTAKDLQDYRDAVREAIHKMDDYHCCGMEDFGSRDRPAERFCEERVKNCDVFVGIIGLLYGDCPEGSDKSYTEIEYDTAVQCDKPRLMFLAPEDFDVPGNLRESDQKRDKQNAFRARVSSKQVRDTFESPDDLATKVLAALRNLEYRRPEVAAPAGPAERPAELRREQEEASRLAVVTTRAPDEARDQQLQALKCLEGAISITGFDSVVSSAESVTDFDIARLFLAAKTLLSKRRTREYLDVHEINFLYLHREELHVQSRERELLCETLLGHLSDVVPGWFWLAKSRLGKVDFRLWVLVLLSKFENVREHALQILGRAGIPLAVAECELKDINVAAVIMDDPSPRVRRAFLDYVAELGCGKHLQLVEDVLSGPDVDLYEPARRAKLSILARSDNADAALYDLIKDIEPPSEMVRVLSRYVNNLSPKALLQAAAQSAARMREFAIEALVERGSLPKETAYDLTTDKSLRVRALSYKYLVNQGERFKPEQIRHALERADMAPAEYVLQLGVHGIWPDEIIYDLFLRYKYDELTEKVNFLGLDAPIAYRVLSKNHFGALAGRVRRDCADGFESLRQQYIERASQELLEKMALQPGDEAKEVEARKACRARVEAYLSEPEGLEDSIKGWFLDAAFSGLVMYAEESDVGLARTVLDTWNPQYPQTLEIGAIKLIGKFGDESDVVKVAAIAKGSQGEKMTVAATAALKLAPGPEGIAKEFLNANPQLFKVAGDHLASEYPDGCKDVFLPYLKDENDVKRAKAVLYLHKTCSEQDLQEILKSYTGQGHYFYNVVCWLDRLLYAPEAIKLMYLQKLQDL